MYEQGEKSPKEQQRQSDKYKGAKGRSDRRDEMIETRVTQSSLHPGRHLVRWAIRLLYLLLSPARLLKIILVKLWDNLFWIEVNVVQIVIVQSSAAAESSS